MSSSTQVTQDTFAIDQILSDRDSWHNIQPIVWNAFKSLTDIVQSQSRAIHDLEVQFSNKVSRHELSVELADKASISDLSSKVSHMYSTLESRLTLIDEKVSLSEVQRLLMNKASYEDVKSVLENKASMREVKEEIDAIYEQVNMVYKEISTALGDVAQVQDIQNLANELKEKVEINKLDEIVGAKIEEILIKALKKKADKSDLQKKADSSDIKTLLTAIESKADSTWIEQINEKIQKIEKNDLGLKKRIENHCKDNFVEFVKLTSINLDSKLAKHVEEVDQYISELTSEIQKQRKNNFVSNHDNLKSEINTKVDSKTLEISLKSLRSEIIELINTLRHENTSDRSYLKDLVMKRSKEEEYNAKVFEEELNYLKEEIQGLKKMSEKNWEGLRNSERNKADLSIEVREITERIGKWREIVELKLERKDFDDFYRNFMSIIENKADTLEIENVLNNKNKQIVGVVQELKEEIKLRYTSLQTEILERTKVLIKRSFEENDFEQMLSERVAFKDFEVIEKQINEVKQEIIIIKNSADVQSMKMQLELLSNEISQKAPIEICKLIDSKPNIEHINQALLQIHTEIDSKLPSDDFSHFIEDQNIIINTLCSEICLGRWLWKSGSLKKNHFIPWEVQSINTNPGLFLWEQDRIYIGIEDSGIYELTIGVYSEDSPSLQLILNGDPVLTKTGDSQTIIKHSNKTISVISIIEFLCIPKKTRISISYSGESRGEGFMGLRKL